MIQVFITVTVLIALAVLGLAVGIIIKGKFPETHAGHNAEMKKLGISCAKRDKTLCKGRSKSNI